MTFDDFKQMVEDNIKDYLPEEYADAKVSINEVIKNNDTHLTGVTIRDEGTSIAPTLYLEQYYEDVNSGNKTMDQALTMMAAVYDDANKNGLDMDTKELVNNLTDYDQTKDKIIPRVVNRESNEERLKTIPHTDMGDLTVTYHVDLGNASDGQMSVQVSNEMMNKYDVSVEDLHEQACANMKEISPATFKTMAETLAEIMIPGFEDMSAEEREEAIGNFDMPDPGMYVLSNDSKSFGAAAVLDPEVMDKIRNDVGDFYILPSSVHEVLIVPKREDLKLEDLEAMVQEVNATQVAPNEVLSDHVFEYDPETKEIYRADQRDEHEKEKEELKAEKNETEKRPSVKAKLEEKKAEAKNINKENKDKDIKRDLDKGRE